jgi:hypothetical protein
MEQRTVVQLLKQFMKREGPLAAHKSLPLVVSRASVFIAYTVNDVVLSKINIFLDGGTRMVPASCLAYLDPEDPSETSETSTGVQGVTSQKVVYFTVTAVRTSTLTL